MATEVNLVNAAEIKAALAELNDTSSPVNWVMLGYGNGKNDVVLVEKSTSGVSGLHEYLKQESANSKIYFILVELIAVTGDDYNPTKNVFITWIGKKVEAGIGKARSSQHRAELVHIIKDTAPVSCEYQTETAAEIQHDLIAQAITRLRPAYATTKVDEGAARKNLSKGGTGITSKLKVQNEDEVRAALRDIKGDSSEKWLILAYVEGQKETIELVKTGSGGLDTLAQEFPKDKVYFCFVNFQQDAPGTREKLNKFVLVSMVGNGVKPIVKARSAGQRQDVQDFILSERPVSTHYQPGSAKDLTAAAISQLLA
eukprot:TRINITY_DN5889_c0_g1_i1.p1 TRINITY_DN5889_c0_g1~~TRINITY_DN5889_c0_g1_i1.p1  ORF type:complete len:327 (+),score=88.36 TRINITY_DN5889_c0_g1_i1:43-981(+)